MLMELALNQVQLNIFVKVKKVVNPSISKVQTSEPDKYVIMKENIRDNQ